MAGKARGTLVVLVAAGLLAACSSAAGVTNTATKPLQSGVGRAGRAGGAAGRGLAGHVRLPYERPAVFGVGMSIATWTDEHGSTENFYEGTSQPGRTMQVEILYPTLARSTSGVTAWAAPAYRYGPYPVIVFAHGFDVDPNTYRALLVSWVAAGYVVVAPFFPDTSLAAIEAQHGVDTESDMFNQPADVAFRRVAGRRGRARVPAAVRGLSDRFGGSRPPCARRPVRRGRHVAALVYDHEYASTRASMAVQPAAVALLSGAEWARAADSYSARAAVGRRCWSCRA